VKALVKAISDHLSKAAAESKAVLKSNSSPKPADSGKPFLSAPSKSTIESKSSDASVGVKRARTGDITGSPNVKRVNTGPVSPSTSKTAAAASGTLKRPLATAGSKSSAGSSAVGTVPVSKSKPTGAASKGVPGFFSSVQSATKKQAGEKSTAVSTQTAGEPAVAVSASTSFSFGGMLEDLLKPRESQTKTDSGMKSQETEADRAKRARKEARRKLRVSWKDDNDLVTVRYFTHDPDEDTGHDANMVRDVADVGKEGRMFKQLHNDSFDDDDEEKEESFGALDYRTPSEVDPSDIEADELAKQYSRFPGGKKLPDSSDQRIQDEREANTLMAIYYSPSDIPPRPRSPAVPYTNTHQEIIMFGQPNDTTKSRSDALFKATQQQNNLNPALSAARNLLANLGNYADPTNAQIPSASGHLSNAELNLPSTSVAFSQAPQFASLFNNAQIQGGLQNPAAPIPPFVPSPTVPSTNPLANFAGLLPPSAFPIVPPNLPPVSGSDVSALIASLTQMNQATSSPQEEYTPPAPTYNTPAFPTSSPQDLTALLAQVGGVAGLNAMMQNVLPPLNQQPSEAERSYSSNYDGFERKRARDQDDDQDDYSRKRQNSGLENGGAGRGNAKPKWLNSGKGKDVHPGKKFSQPCKFWPLGKCLKGTECTYRHDPL
jgi:hypothetical protein